MTGNNNVLAEYSTLSVCSRMFWIIMELNPLRTASGAMSQDLSPMGLLDQSLSWVFFESFDHFLDFFAGRSCGSRGGTFLVRFSACPFLLSIGRSHLSIAESLFEVADSLEAIVLLRLNSV